MKKLSLILPLLSVYFILIFAIYFFKLGGEYFDNVTTVVNVISLLIPIFIGISVVKNLGFSTMMGKSVFYMTLALSSYLIGDVLWIIKDFEVISIADFFYLLTYPLILVGVFTGTSPSAKHFFKNFTGIMLLLFIMLLVYFNFSPITLNSDVNFYENLLTVVYFVADILLFLPVLFITSFIFSETNNTAWVIIGFAIVFLLIADFHYAINFETYVSGDLIDLSWYLSFLLFGLGFSFIKKDSINLKN